jgi:3-hydroxyacyl-CoA dehydrogenase/enoyl-CoA hydratase/3-hydroxybutyryl-CoA epimerase
MTMLAEPKQKALQLEIGEDGVAVVTIDVPGEKLNTLSDQLFQDMDAILSRLEAKEASAVVFISGKAEGFIAGADVKMLAKIQTAEEGEALSRMGQDVLNRIEDLPIPTICAIHGVAMGGGLEFALACRYRIVTADPSTQLALPEVQLGLLPGAGGTQRLPRLIGMQAALDMILTGKRIRADKAKKMGLAHEVVPKELLLDRARRAGRQLARATADMGHIPIKPASAKRPASSIGQLMLQATVPGRAMMYRQVKKSLAKKVGTHYPAPYLALAAVYFTRGHSFKEGLALEAQFFGKLAVTEVARNLQQLFFASTALKSESYKGIAPHKVEKIAVLGGGLMGSGIATVSADKGYRVRVKDRDLNAASKALAYAGKYFGDKVKKRHIRPYQRDMALGLLSVTDQYNGFKNVDMVIEAVFEDINLKHQVLKDVEAITRPDCVFASNTSSLPIAQIAEASKHPETVVGMHYFSPVEKMPLLEVIITDKTADWVTATALAVGKKQGKTCIVVRDGPGFYTSRALAAMMNETVKVFVEGASIEAIDKAMLDFGFPVGPITLIDEVGFDVAHKVLKIMIDAFGNRFETPDEAYLLFGSGRLGRKNKQGFYLYDGDKKKKKEVDPTIYDQMPYGRHRNDPPVKAIQDRLAFAFMNEAAMILEEGILLSPRDGDIGAVFGLGFPPFLGGPFRYMDYLGIENVAHRLRELKNEYSKSFEPAAILVKMAEEGKTFFGPNAIQMTAEAPGPAKKSSRKAAAKA